MGMRMIISNEADFMIKGVFKYEAFGQEFWITTTHIGMWIVSIALVILALFARRQMKKADDVPGLFQNILEIAVEKLDGLVGASMGKNGGKFLNYVGTIFAFILFCNISGLFGLRAPTADFGVTFGLGIITAILIHYNGIKANKFKHFTNLFQPFPILFPINLIGEIANPISISLRLFGNMMSGVIILGIWYGLMPIFANIGLPAFLHVYLDLFSGCIQTYVFCMLTMVYINDKL